MRTIPTISTIVDGLIDGTIERSDAINWLHDHARDAATELRDTFSAMGVSGLYAGMLRDANEETCITEGPRIALAQADSFIRQRENKPPLETENATLKARITELERALKEAQG